MSSRKKTKLNAEKRRELMVAAAVAREAVVATHVTRALKLIELSGNRVSVLRMLSIYSRMHDLGKNDVEVITNRLLAVLGRARKGEKPAVYVEGEDERLSDSRSVVGAMRERLRGRRLHDLRRWVELHTGSTQAALLEIHVKHALRFVYELAGSHQIVDALEAYRELVDVPDNLTDALYIYVMDRLAAEELPKSGEVVLEQDPSQVPLFPVERRRSKRAV